MEMTRESVMPVLADVFAVLNSLKDAQAIEEYAIAGAMAFLFYTEPFRTYDLDVFIFLPPQNGLLITMEPLYRILRERGYTFDAEHVMIHETPVQFLPAYNALSEEAVRQAVLQDYAGVSVRVIRPEHLVALAFQTGGAHRRSRAETLLAEDGIDLDVLNAIMERHHVARPGQESVQ